MGAYVLECPILLRRQDSEDRVKRIGARRLQLVHRFVVGEYLRRTEDCIAFLSHHDDRANGADEPLRLYAGNARRDHTLGKAFSKLRMGTRRLRRVLFRQSQ